MTHEQCDECGFDGSRYDDGSLLDGLRELGPRWRELVRVAGSNLRMRPEPAVWSAIEYAAHSRDITALHVFGALSRRHGLRRSRTMREGRRGRGGSPSVTRAATFCALVVFVLSLTVRLDAASPPAPAVPPELA